MDWFQKILGKEELKTGSIDKRGNKEVGQQLTKVTESREGLGRMRPICSRKKKTDYVRREVY